MSVFFFSSQVDAVAVTDDISFTAVPAKILKAFPDSVEKPRNPPITGKNKASIRLKKNIIDID